MMSGRMFAGLLCAAVLLPFVCHLILSRAMVIFRDPARRQAGAALGALAGILPLSIVCFIACGTGKGSFWPCLYLGMFYCLSGYCYFHVFNMSETSRRLMIMNSLRSGIPPAVFSTRGMVERRLRRLVAAGELRLRDGRYTIGSGFLVRPARVVLFLRELLFTGEAGRGE